MWLTFYQSIVTGHMISIWSLA